MVSNKFSEKEGLRQLPAIGAYTVRWEGGKHDQMREREFPDLIQANIFGGKKRQEGDQAC
jgi:hypothetical protein